MTDYITIQDIISHNFQHRCLYVRDAFGDWRHLINLQLPPDFADGGFSPVHSSDLVWGGVE